MTQEIQRAADALHLTVHDHVVVAGLAGSVSAARDYYSSRPNWDGPVGMPCWGIP